MLNVSWPVATGLHLVAQSIPVEFAAPAVPPSCHRLFVLDCSGSMWDDLPKARQHLKNNLALTLKDGDTVTVIWFSGRGQFGTLLEGVTVNGLGDLAAVHAAIDRFLKPVGLTGFKEPLEEVGRVIGRLKAKDPSAVFSLFFMSDGYDNQWPTKEILAVADTLGPLLASGVVVEYGWYANRNLLAKICESLGAEYVFSEDFGKFAPVFDEHMRRQVDGAKKRVVALPVEPMHGIAFAVRSGAVAVYGTGGEAKVRVPEDVDALYYFSAEPVGLDQTSTADDVARIARGDRGGDGLVPVEALYAALAVFSQRMLADDVFRVLKVLGDVRLVKQFATCFGKQAYSAFQDAAAAAATDPAARWADGYDPAVVPAEDAYTVLDLLAELSEDDGNLLHIGHKAFSYQRTGRKTVDATGQLAPEEQAEIAELTAKARNAADLEAVQKRIAEILAAKPKPVSFRSTDREKGVPMSSLVLNETRPNVSVNTRQEGVVEIGENRFGLPAELPSHVFRNYTVVRDGILNMKVLPVSLTAATFDRLSQQGLVGGAWDPAAVYELSLESLPIINRKMVRKVAAKDCFELEYQLAKARAAQKVFKHFDGLHFPKGRSSGLKEKYGEAAAEWLKTVGVTDGGFQPKVTKAEATDVYIGRELTIALKGLSSLPKVDDVIAKMAGGKLTASQALMAPFVKEYQDFVASPIYRDAADQSALLKTWLGDKSKFWVRRARELNRELSEIKFSVVVGQVWFSEFSSLDEGTLVIRVDGQDVSCTATLKEIEVPV